MITFHQIENMRIIMTKENISMFYSNNAGNYYKEGKYSKAVKNYNKAIQSGGEHRPMIHANKAEALFKLERYTKAIESYNKAIELGGVNCIIYNNKAGAHYRLGQYEEAITNCNKAIELGGENRPMIHTNKAEALFKLGRYTEVIESCDLAIALGEQNIAFILKMKAETRKAPALEIYTSELAAAEAIALLSECIDNKRKRPIEDEGDALCKIAKHTDPFIEVVEMSGVCPY
jgi:tetratricopeptide (TPR) repeat protein